MIRKILAFFALFMLLCAAFSCTKKQILHTESTYSPEMFGSYTLFLYGSRFSSDIETIAILDREGDRFTFEIFKPEFDFKVITGVPAAKAFDEANTSFENVEITAPADLSFTGDSAVGLEAEFVNGIDNTLIN